MGNKLLISILIIFFGFSSLYANEELKKIDSLIAKIKVKRVGIDSKNIKKLKDPFYYEKKYKVERIKKLKRKYKHYYRLYAILNDKAKINRRWYKIGSKVGIYRLYKICDNCVKLRKGNKVLTLFIPRKSRKIKISGK
ncbi:hypothetical protein [Nitrosophilus kaiyonis]|uniref:hypothetical protein n=1 Tax=Nitrosophilus kaiyonis TaxID=2930200 RepID=UPI0024937546|nr:hypothetical protein [Nitrosophilus kaiyonis]